MSRQLQDILSSGEVTDVYQEGTDPGDKLQDKDEVDAGDGERMFWKGVYVLGDTYYKNEVVTDLNWTMICNNTSTIDRAAPIEVGNPVWLRDLTADPPFSTNSLADNTIIMGQRYEVLANALVEGVRLQFAGGSIGMTFHLSIVFNPLTNPDFFAMARDIVITSTSVWLDFPMSDQTVLFQSGLVFDIVLEIENDGAPTETDMVYDYKWATGGPVPVGEAWHQIVTGTKSPIRFNGIDYASNDRNALFATMQPGDDIDIPATGWSWEIQSVDEVLTGIWDFYIAPATRTSKGVTSFRFIQHPVGAIPYVYNTDLFAALSNVSGFIGSAYDPLMTQNQDGYGIDFQLQLVDKSPYWDVVHVR